MYRVGKVILVEGDYRSRYVEVWNIRCYLVNLGELGTNFKGWIIGMNIF